MQYGLLTRCCRWNQKGKDRLSKVVKDISQYSVPPEYIGKEMKLQVYDNYIHIYHNTTLVTLHSLSSRKLNYHEKHYVAIAQQAGVFKKEEIEDRAKENCTLLFWNFCTF